MNPRNSTAVGGQRYRRSSSRSRSSGGCAPFERPVQMDRLQFETVAQMVADVPVTSLSDVINQRQL